jgi:hypothetical protein
MSTYDEVARRLATNELRERKQHKEKASHLPLQWR